MGHGPCGSVGLGDGLRRRSTLVAHLGSIPWLQATGHEWRSVVHVAPKKHAPHQTATSHQINELGRADHASHPSVPWDALRESVTPQHFRASDRGGAAGTLADVSRFGLYRRGPRMDLRSGLGVGLMVLSASLGGCSANCEDDELAQDDPANCAAVGGDDGGSTGGPSIPIDGSSSSSGGASEGASDASTGSSGPTEATGEGETSSGDDTTGGDASSGDDASSSESTAGAPSCRNGIRDGDESDVACGGSTCSACDDGTQNGDETGVDCGGR